MIAQTGDIIIESTVELAAGRFSTAQHSTHLQAQQGKAQQQA